MLQPEPVDKTVLDLIFALQGKDYLRDFFLVGRTGLALMIGHRKSDDIDLFTSEDFDAEYLLEKLESDFAFRMDSLERNTIKGYAEGIKVDLLTHKYPFIGDPIRTENLRIASMDDISAMKVNSVANDGTSVKDFIDLYFLLAEYAYNIERLLKNSKAKYTQRNSFHALKSLNYFENVDLNDWPQLLRRKEITWDEDQNTLGKAFEDYIRKLT
jgi:hypothetical protein